MSENEKIVNGEKIPPLENTLMKFIQIRDEIKESLNSEIDKIPAAIKTLELTTTKFIAHFDDFVELSSRAEKQVVKSVREAGAAAAQIAARELMNLVKSETQQIIQGEIKVLQQELVSSIADLRQAIGLAEQTLRERKIALTRAAYVATSSFCFAALLVAWGIHHFFPQRAYYHLNPAMAKTYFIGEIILDNWAKLSEKEKAKLTAIINAQDRQK